MEKIKKFMKSFKSLSTEWSDGICKDLDDLGYSYDKIKIKRYYKKRFLKYKFIPGESIKEELDSLKECGLVKPNTKKVFSSNKKKVDYLVFELHKNRHLLLLNGSMLDLSYKECDDIEDKRKKEDFHFELIEDLNLQLFYEERKLQELKERIELLICRSSLLENIIELKININKIIDEFIEEFNKLKDSRDVMYQYEVEASNILNEKKYSDEELSNDREDLESTNTECTEINKATDVEINTIDSLKEQIKRVESIFDIELNEKAIKKQSLKK